jgi:hypothetical protein
MTSFRLPSRFAWALPVALVVPFLMGADGGGCEGPGFSVVEDAGTHPGADAADDVGAEAGLDAAVDAAVDADAAPDTGSTADGSTVCTPASCAGQAVPAIAKLCSDGTTVTEDVCEDQGDGRCGWGFAACPADACPPPPLCNLPDCQYGVVPQTDKNGCSLCAICAPAPDAGDCDCGAPPPVAECIGGGSPGVTCERGSTGTCSWVVGFCPTSVDAGSGGPCLSDTDCPSEDECGFPETAGCVTKGTCFPTPGAICNAYSPGCACDGSEINVACTGLPTGYVSKPLLHTGVCTDGG